MYVFLFNRRIIIRAINHSLPCGESCAFIIIIALLACAILDIIESSNSFISEYLLRIICCPMEKK